MLTINIISANITGQITSLTIIVLVSWPYLLQTHNLCRCCVAGAGAARNSLSQPCIWLTILLTAALCILPVVTYRFLLFQLCPTINDKVQTPGKESESPGHVTLKASLLYCSLPGDVQGERSQGHTSTTATTHAHTPHQLPSLGLRLLPRPGLRRPGDFRTLPAALRCDQQDLGSAALGSRHHGLQSNGPLGWVQPHRAAADCQSCGHRGDIAADVQNLLRPSTLTVRCGIPQSDPSRCLQKQEHSHVKDCIEVLLDLFFFVPFFCFKREQCRQSVAFL